MPIRRSPKSRRKRHWRPSDARCTSDRGMTGYFHAAPRPLAQSDAEAVRALVLGTIGVTPYVDRVLEIAQASDGSDSENHGLITERDGTVAALALFGPVAGAERVWHLSTLLIAPRVEVRDVGGTLLDAVTTYLR